MYLVNINRAGDIYKDDDGVMLVPEFQEVLQAEGLGQVAMKWVALVCDYESPYRHFTESERKKAVSKDLYGTYKWKGESLPKVLAALDKYKELQFDPLDEQLIAFNKKVFVVSVSDHITDQFTAVFTVISGGGIVDVKDISIGRFVRINFKVRLFGIFC